MQIFNLQCSLISQFIGHVVSDVHHVIQLVEVQTPQHIYIILPLGIMSVLRGLTIFLMR